MSADLMDRFGGVVPDDLDELVTLRGVGRKTASVVLAEACGKPAIAVDTHVKRLANRLGLTGHDDPTKIEFDLRELYDRRQWGGISMRFIQFGRDVCNARKPLCLRVSAQRAVPVPGQDAAAGVRRSRRAHDRFILALGLPALGALAADPLVSLVDTAFVGRLGTTSLAALGIDAAIFGLAFFAFNFLAYGVTPLVAKAIGEGDTERAARVIANGLVAGYRARRARDRGPAARGRPDSRPDGSVRLRLRPRPPATCGSGRWRLRRSSSSPSGTGRSGVTRTPGRRSTSRSGSTSSTWFSIRCSSSGPAGA